MSSRSSSASGAAVIEHRYIAGARALDADQTRRRAGVDADARAHLVLRPYVATAVEITLDDPADPVPYWLVSTRRPDALAAALERLVDTTAGRMTPSSASTDPGDVAVLLLVLDEGLDPSGVRAPR